MSKGIEDCLLDVVLDGVGGGRISSGKSVSARSALFPASRTVRFGDARARASIRKVGRAAKEA
jgi:hypothetical protein